MTTTTVTKRAATGALTGLALGDALGFPTEFNDVPSILAKSGPWRGMDLPRPAIVTDVGGRAPPGWADLPRWSGAIVTSPGRSTGGTMAPGGRPAMSITETVGSALTLLPVVIRSIGRLGRTSTPPIGTPNGIAELKQVP